MSNSIDELTKQRPFSELVKQFGLRKAKLKIFKEESNDNNEDDLEKIDHSIELEKLEKPDLAEDSNKPDA